MKSLHKDNYFYELSYTLFSTPIGELIGVCADSGVCLLYFTDCDIKSMLIEVQKTFSCNFAQKNTVLCRRLQTEVREYFAGDRQEFTLPLTFIGNNFQKKIWHHVESIEYGRTQFFKQPGEGDLSPEINNSPVIRAVDENKLLLLVPSHRVLNSAEENRKFPAGEHRKKYLLDFEKRILASMEIEAAKIAAKLRRARNRYSDY
ncbi:methylated-DNA--[protein]-cysteine S-methyltransferase [Psittacicella hinzii]|nr:MGMT family protein [Psittacicella hinzii]